jgi:hypothetical protein
MRLTQLTNDEVKKLEIETEQFVNLLTAKDYDEIRETFFEVLCWYRHHNLIAGKLYDHVEILTKLFGVKPNYFVDYSHRNAVWGFEWEGNKFVFYKSIEGLSIQVLPDFPNIKFKQFFIELRNLLYS